MAERMIEVKVSQLLVGDIIAADVYSVNGKILIVKNTKVNDNIILGLKKNYIYSVFIFRNISEIEKNVSINTKDIMLKEAGDIINNYVLKFVKKDKNIQEIKNTILDTLMINKNFDLIFSLRALGENIFRHSICVAFYSIAIAKEMGTPNNRLSVLAQASLLHDVGMMRVPREVFNKTGGLTEEEKNEMQMHTQYSFEILKENAFPSEICTIVYEHHERFDGTGYPNKRTNDSIHTMAKIIAVSDVYDALTSDRPYRPKYKRSESVEYLLGTGDFYFNYEIIKALINTIIIYPYGLWVELSTKEIGLVVDEEVQQSNFKPRVVIYFDKDGERLATPKVMDLSYRDNANISIERII